MSFRRRRILGLVLEEHALLVAELRGGERRATLTCLAEFPWEEPLLSGDPQLAGEALHALLRQCGFGAREAILGVPAAWLLTARRPFPPAPPAAVAGMVRLEAERTFATDSSELLLDYPPRKFGEEGQELLLTALPRRTMDYLRTMMQAAGLKLRAVTSTSMALAAALPSPSPRVMLMLRPQLAELVVPSGEQLSWVRHVALPASALHSEEEVAEWSTSAAELLARVAALAPPPEGEGAETVAIWDGVGLPEEVLQQIGQTFGLPYRAGPTLAEAGVKVPAEIQQAIGPAASAAVLARVGMQGRRLPVDFVHSRLEVRRRPRTRRALGVAAFCLALLALGFGVQSQRRAEADQLRALQQQLADMRPQLEVAQQQVDRVTQARRWTSTRPRLLDPLREVALTFPVPRKLWVTSLAVQDDLRVLLSGKSEDEQSVLSLLDRLQARHTFKSAKLAYLRRGGTENREVAFAVTGDYREGPSR